MCILKNDDSELEVVCGLKITFIWYWTV